METPLDPSEGPPAIGSPPCVFPVVHDGSRWFEMLAHVGFAVFLLALAHLANGYWGISGAFLLIALYQAAKAACWVWRRSAERLEITSNEIVWHLGYARLRIPCDTIVDVTPVPGIRLTTRVTPDLLLRLSKTVHWEATPRDQWLWWLVWKTLPGSPDGAFVRGDMQVVQIAPESDRNFLDELHSRHPRLANSTTAAADAAIRVSGIRSTGESQSLAGEGTKSVEKPWPRRRFETVGDSFVYIRLGCLVFVTVWLGTLTLWILVFADQSIAVYCLGLIVSLLLSCLAVNIGETNIREKWVELGESTLTWSLGGAELCVPYEHIVRVVLWEPTDLDPADTRFVEIETMCPVEWKPCGFGTRIWWLIRGSLPRPPKDAWNWYRDGLWFRKCKVLVRNAAEFERELARRCPVKVTATGQGAS